ncbi:hypothetical protein QN277_019129 [Acacia crassicarpa]|uniref:BURP domain-containing protein n=1 Tax=Acacia crassicarpa TaxID=499986 RepID=A0AAE1JRZ4_9FABA|nr:hypothetical protein QN277_019129 [Acacia crassicarpa]
MDALYEVSVHWFFNNGDSGSTYGCRSRSIMRTCIFILYINLVATHAALTPELYWKSMLPTAPIPKSIAVLLRTPGKGSTVHSGFVSSKSVGYPVNEYMYGYHRCCESKLQNKPDTAIFFLENNLKSGHKMKLLFEKTSIQASFLPSEIAEILNKFAVKPGSIKADVMKNTIKLCEESEIKGEDKYCATSLEAMLDFIIMKLGKNVEALSTEVMKKETKKQEYTITNGVKKEGGTKVMVCHKLDYVYAVFYCHKIENSVTYTVSLEGADGSRVKAVSVCHRDTSKWNPKHLAFQMLNVKPGSVPICHFLFQDTIAWVPKQN